MKKLLKSILIATASIGTIAGSVATVVSCGSTSGDTTSASQEDYQDALTAVVNHFKKNALFTIELTTQVDTIKEQIQQNIYKYIKSVGAGALTAFQLKAINVTAASDIQLTDFIGFTQPAVTPTAGQAIDGRSTNLTISIPAAAGLTQGTISCVGTKYIVNAPVVPADQSKYHTEALTFATNLINFTQQTGKAFEIQSLWTSKSVKESVLSYINDYMNRNYDPQYITELKVTDLTMENDSIIQDLTGNPAVASGISVNIPPKAGVQANFERFNLNFTYVILQTPNNPQDTFNSSLATAAGAFVNNVYELFPSSPSSTKAEIIENIKISLKRELLSITQTNVHLFDFSSLDVQITGNIPLVEKELQKQSIPSNVTITFHINSGTKNVTAPDQTTIAADSKYTVYSDDHYKVNLITREYSPIYFHTNPLFRATAAEMADSTLTSVKAQILTNFKNYIKTFPTEWIDIARLNISVTTSSFIDKTSGIYFTDVNNSDNRNIIHITIIDGFSINFLVRNAKFVVTA